MATTDDYGGVGARVYGAYIERPLLGRAVIRLLWGGDARPMYHRSNGEGDRAAPLTRLGPVSGVARTSQGWGSVTFGITELAASTAAPVR